MGKRAYFRAVCAATLLACLSALLSQAEGVRARTLQFAVTDSACLDGSKPVNCFADPCTTQCKCGADQKCLADYCGQCSCKCVEASELECKPEKAVCSVSQAGECCGGLVCSPAPDCQPSKTARCATVCQAGMTQAEEPPSFDTRCPEGAGKYQCFVSPCDGGDKCKKEYKCVENYCEGCNFDCVPVDDVSYPTDPDTTKALCPDGSQPVQCFADPCGTGQCECSEEQTCVSDYCGGCNCKCMDNPKPVPMQTPFSPKCLEGADKYQCLVSPCAGEHKCKEGYVCVENYCKGCNFDCVPVDDVSYPTDPDTKALCPDGSQPVQCFADPCSTGQCECGEEQTCESNYCGGCNCKCVDKPRAEDPPLAPKCPYSASVYNCLVSPCEGGDKCKPGYTCVENYCDGCNFDCVEVIKMPSDDQQHEGETDSTNNPGSGPGSGSETCKPIGASCSFAAADDECCGDSQCRVDLACKGVNCGATCTRPLPPILQPKCPDGAVTYNCFASPCDVNKCDEGYTCVENYCGGCNFTCVVTPSPLVKPTSKCPEGADTYACLISPCDVNKCDEGLTCVENYCEGCNFDCVSKKNDNKPGKGGNGSAGGGGGRCAKPGKSCSSLNSNRWCCNPSKYKCSAGRCKPCAKEGEKCSLRDRNCCAGLKCKKPCARGEVCDAVCSSD